MVIKHQKLMYTLTTVILLSTYKKNKSQWISSHVNSIKENFASHTDVIQMKRVGLNSKFVYRIKARSVTK